VGSGAEASQPHDAPAPDRTLAASWRPRPTAFVVTFVLFTATGLWACAQDTEDGPVGWYTSVLWTLPVLTAAPSLLGGLLTSRRLRAPDAPWSAPGTVDDLLVVVVPTIARHDTCPALERVIASFLAWLPERFAQFRIDVVVEQDCEAADTVAALASHGLPVRVLTVPRGYRTPGGSRFKARANHFAHLQRITEGEARDDVWVLHMDDDTGIGPDTVDSLAGFIAQASTPGRLRHLGQGVLTFPREQAGSRLIWLADAIRPGCDIGLFSASTGRGSPRCGLHGELLLVRASAEASIGWDFGPRCLVEDAEFAMLFCERYPGLSGWFPGRSYGASPLGLRDFLRQRERWVWGLLELAVRSRRPWRLRAPLVKNVAVWVCSPLQHPGVVLLGGLLIGDLDTTPVHAVLVPVWSLAMGCCVWLYWEGLRLNTLASARPRPHWWEPVALLVLLPVLTALEAAGVVRGVVRFLRQGEQAFTVIPKPR
jgi:hypothetical protein